MLLGHRQVIFHQHQSLVFSYKHCKIHVIQLEVFYLHQEVCQAVRQLQEGDGRQVLLHMWLCEEQEM